MTAKWRAVQECKWCGSDTFGSCRFAPAMSFNECAPHKASIQPDSPPPKPFKLLEGRS